ncbi:MAG: tRNA (adenosine(37)-N6)-threonylcarbamoyltransferase complex dimerization subunit type 1 TsaB [Thiobacillus sp.]|nr:tRNA (adenosine(37)-N6)-threonylcarbamoyltransferase complex dimerization subunit type 1 TsaB [Gammaproteobacteria bacterium]MBU4500763.1 tRNA (adenosine(37)-N6)-threonylcarbamoyltransferase complex dimerization subunit type 1 TsaB [Gammaproteobacteria bacterium]MDO9009902.1 tRNA (adenosine(37)-N6)-threonylcarbamoyltransferase complex dimerization subunit type 1 TsaB [Thiobacillus sp.]MDP1926395.1 tRNA (adenosine(37)-N6)-threonylcarbamoyltransferase complex dimerization subunit type 1 TsaB [T
MKLLVIDTSTEWCSAALWLEGRILARRVLAEQRHSSLLLPMVDELLQESALSLRQLDGIGYGAGPGSFTGLRIACAVTQGLALGADLPVVGVSTLESIAEQTGAESVLAVLDARMAEVYWAAYQRAGAGWQCVTEPALALPESVSVPDGGGDWVGAGNGFAALGAVLRPRLAAQLTRIDDSLMPDAAAMAGLAARAFGRGEGMDAALAAPIYLRDKVALTIDERRAKRSA